MRILLLMLTALSLAACNLQPEDAAPTLDLTMTVPDVTPTPENGVPWYAVSDDEPGVVVGCDVYAETINSGIAVTGDAVNDVRAALEDMFDANIAYIYDTVEYLNYWGGGVFQVNSVSLEGARLNVAISGELLLEGVCSDAAQEAQLLLTIFEYDAIQEAYITIDGENMKQIFDAAGFVEDDEPYTLADIPTP